MLHCGEGRGWRWAMAKVGQTCQGFEGRPRVIEMTWEANEGMNKKKRLSMTLRSELMNDIHLFCEWWVVWRMHFESVLGLRGHLAMTQFAQCIALWMSCKVRLKGIDKIKFGHTQCMHCLVRGWIPVIMFVGWNHIWWCWGAWAGANEVGAWEWGHTCHWSGHLLLWHYQQVGWTKDGNRVTLRVGDNRCFHFTPMKWAYFWVNWVGESRTVSRLGGNSLMVLCSVPSHSSNLRVYPYLIPVWCVEGVEGKIGL